jgi:hypothetical protein
MSVPANYVAPMEVNSDKVVANLAADKLDGKSDTDFYAAGSKVADSSHADQADERHECPERAECRRARQRGLEGLWHSSCGQRRAVI